MSRPAGAPGRVRLARPVIEDDDLDAVADVLRTGYLVQGETVARFESAVASLVGSAHAVAVTNCTAALHLSLLATGVGPGDTVAVAAYSFPATANAVELCGARPRFVDIERMTWNMDPDALAAVLDDPSTPPPKVVLPVHTFGRIAAMDAIIDVAGRSEVPVIEDAACALGAALGGRPAGSWGSLGCFSFHPRKAVTTGEGGMVTTDDGGAASRLRALRNHGMDPDAGTPDFVLPGFNCRLTEFQAALGLVQLGKLDRIVAERRRLADRYAGALAGTPVTVPSVPSSETHVFQSYVVLVPAGGDRQQAFIDGLRARGVESTIGTYHQPLVRYYRERYGYVPGDFPVTDDIAGRAVSLPLYAGMSDADHDAVCDAVRAVSSELA